MRFERDTFEANNALASNIGEQNSRWLQVEEDPVLNPEVTDRLGMAVNDIRTAAEEGIRSEQSYTLDLLGDIDHSQYEDLANKYNRIEELLRSKQAALEQLNDTFNETEDAQTLRTIARKAMLYSPTASPDIQRVARTSTEQLLAEESATLEKEIQSLKEELLDLGEVFDVAAQAWPIPQVPQTDLIEGILIEDTFPTEPGEINRIASGIIIEKHGLTYGASALLASILVNNEARIFLPQELVKVVYGVDTGSEDTDPKDIRGYNNRIHRLLNTHDSQVPEIITEASDDRLGGQYKLQYGWRRFVDSTSNKPTQRPRRVYRVVFIKDGESEVQETFEDIVDPGSEQCPPVITREMLGLAKSIKDRGQESTGDLDSETTSEHSLESTAPNNEEEFVSSVKDAIDILAKYQLLPENFDDKINAQSFKVSMLSKIKNGRKSKNEYIKSLWELANSTESTLVIDAMTIVVAALKKSYLTINKCHSEKEYSRRVGIVEAALIDYYEQTD